MLLDDDPTTQPPQQLLKASLHVNEQQSRCCFHTGRLGFMVLSTHRLRHATRHTERLCLSLFHVYFDSEESDAVFFRLSFCIAWLIKVPGSVGSPESLMHTAQ